MCQILHVFIRCCYTTASNMGTLHPPCLHPGMAVSQQPQTWNVGWLVKLLLAFGSTVIPGFNLFEIHVKDFCSFLDMNMFQSWDSSLMREWAIFLCIRYVCCTIVSLRKYPRCHGVQVTMDYVYPLLLSTLSNIYARYAAWLTRPSILQLRLSLSPFLVVVPSIKSENCPFTLWLGCSRSCNSVYNCGYEVGQSSLKEEAKLNGPVKLSQDWLWT
jgi:hypothetical protein